MNDPRTPTSSFEVRLSIYIPTFGQALVISAAEREANRWIAEYYILRPNVATEGAIFTIGAETGPLPGNFNPLPGELKEGMRLAVNRLHDEVFRIDRDLWHYMYGPDFLNAPLTLDEIAVLRLRSEFSAPLGGIQQQSRCSALKTYFTNLQSFSDSVSIWLH